MTKSFGIGCLTVFLVLFLAGGAAAEEGRKDLKVIFDQVPMDDLIGRYPNAAYERLLELMDSGKRFVSEASYRSAERNLEEALDHHAKLKSDPTYLDQHALRWFVHSHPVFRHVEFEVIARPPHYVVVEASESAPAPANYPVQLAQLHEKFRDLFAERFDLPPLVELTHPSERTLKFFVFRKKESFDKYQKLIGMPLPPGVTAYYTPKDQWIVIFDDGMGLIDDRARCKVLHDSTHQLVHLFTKVTMQRAAGGEEVLWTDHRTHSRSLWFQEGIAEFLSATRKLEDGSLEFLVPHPYRPRELEMNLQSKRVVWTLGEVLSIRSSVELRRRARQKGLAEGPRLSSLFYAQAWKLFHFLWFFEEGKYREKLLAYMEKELNGISGPEIFTKVWFGNAKPDWTAMEKELRAYTPR